MAVLAVLGAGVDVDTMRLVLKADDRAPGKARERIAKLRRKLEPRFDDVVLVISELVTNSVRHSSSTQPIKLLIEISGSGIRLEVSDHGTGFDAPQGMKSGGLGLLIVDRIAASWGVHTNGLCTVWVDISTIPEIANVSDPGKSPAEFMRQRGG